MSFLHAKSIDIAGFRGIAEQIHLAFGEKLTIIYGGNATGKSSIAQAIEFALTGQVAASDDASIPVRYLKNSLRQAQGRVSLELSGRYGPVSLSASTEEARNDIERRFRQTCSVEWPEKQRVPIATTHLTSQGALVRALSAGAVTRNDLSSLCASSQLRLLLSRAERLADYFRQASTGRNIQSALREAEIECDRAKLLLDSLGTAIPTNVLSAEQASEDLRALASDMKLPETSTLPELLTRISGDLLDAEAKFARIQRLLVRMQELGQYESEFASLTSAFGSIEQHQREVNAQRAKLAVGLEGLRSAELAELHRQTSALEATAAHERFQQSVVRIESLSARARDIERNQSAVLEKMEDFAEHLRTADTALQESSEVLVKFESAKSTCFARLQSIRAGMQALDSVPEEEIAKRARLLQENIALAEKINREVAAAQIAVNEAAGKASAAEQALNNVSEHESRFLKAVTQLETEVVDDACPLCGHNHESKDALERAIKLVIAQRSVVHQDLRGRFEQAEADRRQKTSEYDTLRKRADGANVSVEHMKRSVEELALRRSTVVLDVQGSLARVGVRAEVSTQSLSALKDSLDSEIALLEAQIADARERDLENRNRRDDFESALRARRVEREDLIRLANEVAEQIDSLRASLPSQITSEELLTARQDMALAERTVAGLRLDIGKVSAELVECDRDLADSAVRATGMQRRLEVLRGLLGELDAELKAVGATRDVDGLLRVGNETREHQDELIRYKMRAETLQQRFKELEVSHSYVEAKRQHAAAGERLQLLRIGQSKRSIRAEQFSALKAQLEAAQSLTAEAVLRNVRLPVGVLFRAMTAGCAWDIEFALEESGRVEARLSSGNHTFAPATAMLNAAYVNVAAIALRVALASQQNWTSLRTIVLDDPILEMDSLTQVGLIDGIEAILASPLSPWADMQIILTTWSEDFAVLAAHKLAHLNESASIGQDNFVIYRLSSDRDGGIKPVRHAPRWKTKAHAA